MKTFLGICLLFATTLLIGCSTTKTNTDYFVKQVSELQTINNMNIGGKIALLQKNSKLSSYLNIEINKDNFVFYLTSLTGDTIFKLTQENDIATLVDSNGMVHEHSNTDALVEGITGINIPCKELKNILLGEPNGYNHNRNEDGSLKDITLNKYKIEYKRYQTINKYIVPKLITITGNDIIIRININKWEL